MNQLGQTPPVPVSMWSLIDSAHSHQGPKHTLGAGCQQVTRGAVLTESKSGLTANKGLAEPLAVVTAQRAQSATIIAIRRRELLVRILSRLTINEAAKKKYT